MLPFVFGVVWLYFTPVATVFFPFMQGALQVKLQLFGEWLLDYDQSVILDP